MRVIIVDIDGTLANNDHRQAPLLQESKDWDAYNATMALDTPHQNVVDLTNYLFEDIGRIILCTGREERYRGVTDAWLERHQVNADLMLMRANGDYRTDAEIKSDMLDRIRAEFGEPWFVLEDRKQCVDMWRERGLTCFQVAPGDF